MVSKARPSALPILATKNYFSDLATMDLEIKEVEAVSTPAHEHAVEYPHENKNATRGSYYKRGYPLAIKHIQASTSPGMDISLILKCMACV